MGRGMRFAVHAHLASIWCMMFGWYTITHHCGFYVVRTSLIWELNWNARTSWYRNTTSVCSTGRRCWTAARRHQQWVGPPPVRQLLLPTLPPCRRPRWEYHSPGLRSQWQQHRLVFPWCPEFPRGRLLFLNKQHQTSVACLEAWVELELLMYMACVTVTVAADSCHVIHPPSQSGCLCDGDVHLFVCSIVCRLKCILVGHWPSSASSVEEIHLVGTISNVETSYFTQLKMCYLMTTFRCPSDILITSWSRRFYVIDCTNWMNLFKTVLEHVNWCCFH